VYQLWSLCKPMAKVFTIFGVPATGADSVAHWMQATFDVVQLHMPCCTADQAASIRAAVRAFVVTSLDQFVKSLNLCRFEADAHVKLECKLTGETQIALLHSILRSLNVTAAHKRSGATHLDRHGVKVPRLVKDGGKQSHLAGGASGSEVVERFAAGGWSYNLRGIRAWQEQHKVKGCAHAWCFAGVRTKVARLALQQKHCPKPDAPGHEEGGALHSPPDEFRSQNFVLSTPTKK
jgi:hypothetical protein